MSKELNADFGGFEMKKTLVAAALTWTAAKIQDPYLSDMHQVEAYLDLLQKMLIEMKLAAAQSVKQGEQK
jgi:hypothetical protein